jgi:hypothetical protein
MNEISIPTLKLWVVIHKLKPYHILEIAAPIAALIRVSIVTNPSDAHQNIVLLLWNSDRLPTVRTCAIIAICSSMLHRHTQ